MFALWPFDAKAADEGRSFLRGQLGRQVFGRNVTIRTDPGDPRCPGGPFDGDGFAARPITWIRRGVVENLIYSRFWAKKKRKTPTGWPVNHIMDGEGASVDAMIASTERGLLVTRFWYVRYVDPMLPSVTGMTRDGLFLIRNGRLAGPVRQMRFNENLRDMLNRVEMTGSPARAGLLVPALKIRDFNFTSATRFA
jgi:predicted Zn-dependent protease